MLNHDIILSTTPTHFSVKGVQEIQADLWHHGKKTLVHGILMHKYYPVQDQATLRQQLRTSTSYDDRI